MLSIIVGLLSLLRLGSSQTGPAAGRASMRIFSVVYFAPQTCSAAEHVDKMITAAEDDQKTCSAAENTQKRSRLPPAWRPQTLHETRVIEPKSLNYSP
jgi:hypothetical protein